MTTMTARTILIENLRCRAQRLIDDIENLQTRIGETNPLAALRCLATHLKTATAKTVDVGEADHALREIMEEKIRVSHRLAEIARHLNRFLQASKPANLNPTPISHRIAESTGFPAVNFMNADRNHHRTERLDDAVLVTFVPAPAKANKPQPTRPVALAAAKAVRELESQGFRTIPGLEPYSILVTMPAAKVSDKELERIERLTLVGIGGVLAADGKKWLAGGKT